MEKWERLSGGIGRETSPSLPYHLEASILYFFRIIKLNFVTSSNIIKFNIITLKWSCSHGPKSSVICPVKKKKFDHTKTQKYTLSEGRWWTHSKKRIICWSRKNPKKKWNLMTPFTMDFQPPELWESKYLLSHPIYGSCYDILHTFFIVVGFNCSMLKWLRGGWENYKPLRKRGVRKKVTGD